ncbi:hypothetical protein BN128_1328 [Cronobacter sakazakii 696]|nr:hypothetical protein BN128_1328 [Cronobacter sakazakii 696]
MRRKTHAEQRAARAGHQRGDMDKTQRDINAFQHDVTSR